MSCCQILSEIIRRPKNENLIWIYFLRPISYILTVIALLGLTYLYLVPFTNLVGMGLFADYNCPTNSGVWGHCDPVGLGVFAFTIIQATLGLWILGFIFYGCSRRKGYIKT